MLTAAISAGPCPNCMADETRLPEHYRVHAPMEPTNATAMVLEGQRERAWVGGTGKGPVSERSPGWPWSVNGVVIADQTVPARPRSSVPARTIARDVGIRCGSAQPGLGSRHRESRLPHPNRGERLLCCARVPSTESIRVLLGSGRISGILRLPFRHGRAPRSRLGVPRCRLLWRITSSRTQRVLPSPDGRPFGTETCQKVRNAFRNSGAVPSSPRNIE